MRGSLLRQAVGQIRADACATFAGVPGLFEPKDWSKLGQAAIERCTGLLNNVTISEPSSQTVRDLDEMSDVLCQVLDAAEFCRNVHSNASWRDAAERTCVELSGFVHELNTNFTLYTALKNAIASSKTMTTSSSWDSETGMVARMLLRDFERYGVHLEGTTKDRMTQLVAQHQIVGYEFGHNAADPKQCGQLTIQGAAARRVSQLPSALQNEFSTAGAGILTARGQSSTLFGIMGFSNEESLRKAAYDLYNKTPSNNRDLLARLLEIRREIAGIMGYPSYAAYQLHGASLAGDPSAVTEFLQGLSKDSNDKAAAEIQELMGRNWAAKGGLPHLDLDGKPTKHAGRLAAWDKDWLVNKAVNSSKEMQHFNILNNRMFTLNGCLAAMNEIFSKTMGVVLHEVEPQRNEIWAHGVRKITVENDSDGFLGCIYFDPYKRSRKFPGAAHFTLRCGREKSGGSGSGTYVTYQTPVVAVVTNFHSLDSTLSFSEVETLFHEFGHALNSVLSRTRFQHLSGTRGSQDIVEIPSHVFERFASDPEVISLLVKHSSALNHRVAQNCLPLAVLTSAMACKRQFSAIKLQSQVVMAALDQYVHGERFLEESGTLEKRIAGVGERHSLLYFGEHYQPLLRFQHLVTYGGMYYCYLFAQCISASIWEGELKTNFLSNTTMRERNLLGRRLLEPGGAMEPVDYVSGLWEHSSSPLVTAGNGGCYPKSAALLRYLGITT